MASRRDSNRAQQLHAEKRLMAYLVMMTARLIELRRVLEPSGSLFLHCDASASHYLKIIMDEVFGGTFRNEIIWRRSTGKSLMTRRLPTNHDVLLFYAGEDNTWNDEEAFLEGRLRMTSQGRYRMYAGHLAN